MINVEWYQKIVIRILVALLIISNVSSIYFYRRVKNAELVKNGLEKTCKELAVENKELNRLLDNYTITIQ
jgi:hypothetical protein